MTRLLLLLAAPLLGLCYAQVSVSSELTQVQTLEPGETYQGTINVNNAGDQPAAVRLYQTDYVYRADGATEYGEPGSNSRSNAPWISLSTSTARVPADDRLLVTYRLQVPDNAALSGSYWSLIMVEQVAEVTAEADGLQAEPAVGISTVTRYAVEAVTNIGTSGTRQLELANPSLRQTEAKQGVFFRVDVTNPGERYLTPLMYLELYDESGTQVGRFGDQLRRLYPATSVRQDFNLGVLTPGDYTAVVIADAGGEDVFGTRYSLNVGAGDTP